MIVLSDFKEPDSIIRLQQNDIKAVMDHKELGTGTLYITESLLSWQGPQGFSIPYPNISMHAISKDPTLYPAECLYLMIDKHVKLSDALNADADHHHSEDDNDNDNDSDSDNESDCDISELIFVPENQNALSEIYEAIKQCQELHPDPADVSTDEDEAFEDMMDDQDVNVAEGVGIDANINMENLTLNEHQQQNGFQVQRQSNHMEDEDEDQDQFEDAD